MIARLLLPALALSAPDAAQTPDAGVWLEQALAYCAFDASGVDGTVTIPVGVDYYQPIPPAAVRQLKATGQAKFVGLTTSDLPPPVARYAATQPAARRTDVDPVLFDYFAFSGKVWVVSYPRTDACDVMVTGVTDHLALRDRSMAKMEQDGWAIERPIADTAAPFWSASLVKDGMRLVIEGLGKDADRKGVQMSWQFQRLASD
ncbi:hypothetical protein [Erythrobacter colymbi]|uniref:hypothetical protein n=1 Tax=Erythrobacter colymbi TaxID=1161202 RepID=UPI000A3C994B|nr:hypothetical protein [Erythrobacter colymbi]